MDEECYVKRIFDGLQALDHFTSQKINKSRADLAKREAKRTVLVS
jgi:hypothetical protein